MGRKYKKGICERCKKHGYVNDHHITPKQYKKDNNKETLRLCLDCHVELHEELPDELKTETDFKNFTAKWLIGIVLAVVVLSSFFAF